MFNIKKAIAVSSITIIVTTLFFVFCGDEGTPDYCGDGHPLNSVTQFCFGGETFDKCGGQEFNPTVKFCDDDRLHDRCGGDTFDPVMNFCNNNVIVQKCGGNTYNPDVRFCHDQTLYDRCEGGIYNPAERFCHGNVQYPLCEGVDYNPTTHGCHFDVLRPRCGVDFYDPSFQFCHNNISYVMCEGKTWTPPNNPCGDNIQTYTLKTNIIPEDGGSVTRRPNRTNYEPGTEITLTATSLPGYRFNGWTNAPTYVNASNESITVVIPTSDLEMAANFQRIYTLTVDRNLTAGGNVRIGSGSNNPSPTIYDAGTWLTVSATSSNGYRFVSWSGASESTNSTIDIEMTDDLTLTANFIKTHVLSVSISPSDRGSVSVNGTTTTSNTVHDDGASVSVTAMANAEYEFVNWTAVSGSLPTGIDATSPDITFNINGNVSIRAKFVWITTHGTFTDDRDGQTYRTVVMPDGKTWMAENLNYATSSGSWCYDDQMSNCNIYGRLYDWATAMNIDDYTSYYRTTVNSTVYCGDYGGYCQNPSNLPHRGICPDGWHLPTLDDWQTLATAVTSCIDEWCEEGPGTKLRSETGWGEPPTFSDVVPATNEFNFSALPGGYRYMNGNFWNVGQEGSWWPSTLYGYVVGYYDQELCGLTISMYNNASNMSNLGSRANSLSSVDNGHSIRCVKDD